MSLEVAINSQDYTSDAVPFFYYAPPSVTSVSPASGIFYGGTTVILAEHGLLHAAAPAAQCRFGGDYRAAYDCGHKWFGVSLVMGTVLSDFGAASARRATGRRSTRWSTAAM